MLAEEKVRQGGQGDDREGRQVRDRSCSANRRLGDGQMDLTEQNAALTETAGVEVRDCSGGGKRCRRGRRRRGGGDSSAPLLLAIPGVIFSSCC